MARLVTRSGTVLRVDRVTTAWQGEHGDRATALDLGGIAVHYGGMPSVAVGDLVTVVGYESDNRVRASALRNDSTDVSYAPATGSWVAIAATLLGIVAPLTGFPLAFISVPLGGWTLGIALRNYRARLLLNAHPSRHAAPLKAPRRPTDPAPQS